MLLNIKPSEEIVVIGAGVVGLTIALRLQELGYKVHIVAKDFPAPFETIDPLTQINYSSPWAGAHNGWGRDLPGDDASPQDWRDHSFALKTFARMSQLHAEFPDAGVTFTRGFQYYDDPPRHIKQMNQDKASGLGIQDFHLVPEDQLPKGVKFGYGYKTWFSVQGGTIVKREIRGPEEIFESPDLPRTKHVVNASGTGFGDDKVFITRGQTCVVANPCDISISRQYADGTSSFCIPRNFSGGTIVGGTHEPHDWNPVPAEGMRDHILKRLAETYPEILGSSGKFTPLRDIVGRRPTRKRGMRLEKEDVGDGKTVVHAYGVGGRGYEMSWGVADAVASIIGSK